MNKFTITIELGNEAMQSPEHVSLLLQNVVSKLDNAGSWENFGYANLRDANGNLVGAIKAPRS